MAKTNTINIKQLKSLCAQLPNGDFVSKSGVAYVDSLKKLFKFNNRNDIPFTLEEVEKEPQLKDFLFKGKNDFKHNCKLKAEPLIIKGNSITNERIVVDEYDSNKKEEIFKTTMGVCYLLTMCVNDQEHIIKFGNTRTPFVKRLGSYNCGTVKARYKGTCSSTNFKILQSLVTTRKELEVYLWEPDENALTYKFHGVESVPFASPKSLAVEDIMVKQYVEQFDKLPLANIQGNATEVN